MSSPTLVQVIYLVATFDALNLGALASVEMVARRIATIAEAHRGGANAVPRWEATRHIVGVTDPYDLVSAELRGHVARATKEDVELQQLIVLAPA